VTERREFQPLESKHNRRELQQRIDGTSQDVRKLWDAYWALRRMTSWRTRHAAYSWLGERLIADARADAVVIARDVHAGGGTHECREWQTAGRCDVCGAATEGGQG